MTNDEQLQRWVNGDSQHQGDGDERQCCPDFSCCVPDLLAPDYERKAFATADEKTRMGMLGTFLQRAMSKHFADKKVYVAGVDTEPDTLT